MTENKFYKKILKYGKYRITNNNDIDLNNIYDLFYFIVFDNRVNVSKYIKLDSSNINEFKNSKSIFHYLTKKSEKHLENYHPLDKKDFKVYIFCIERSNHTKNVYNFFDELNTEMILDDKALVGLKDKFFNILSNNNFILTTIITLLLFLYTSMAYMTLASAGFNIKIVDNLNIIISIVFFQFTYFISIIPVTIIVGIRETINPLYLLISIIGFFIVYYLIKRLNIYYVAISFLNFLKILIINLMTYLFIAVFLFFCFIVVWLPLPYSFDNVKIHSGFKDMSFDGSIFDMYFSKVGYPKILLEYKENEKKERIYLDKYIFFGIKDGNYQVYDVLKTTEYLRNIGDIINKKDISKNWYIKEEQFCRNVSDLKFDVNSEVIYTAETKFLYEILKNSVVSKPYNIEWLNTSTVKVEVKPFRFKELNLNYGELKKNCDLLVKKMDTKND